MINIKDSQLLKKYNILEVSKDSWIASRGYRLYKFDVPSKTWKYFSRIDDIKNFICASFFLTKRLFRSEITKYYSFGEHELCIAKKGIFKYDKKTRLFKKVFSVTRGSRPLNLCQSKTGVIYFGEYFYNPKNDKVNIYKSVDNGIKWDIAYTFAKGEINHIHGIFNDPYTDKLWVFTGDLDNKCIIAQTSDEFKTLDIVYRGGQKYRVCVPLFYKDRIVYATDTQYENNCIRSIDRETLEVSDICGIQGSGIYGGQIGDFSYISTTVEPSIVNNDNYSYLWISYDGSKWECICCYKKDILDKKFFQFGSIRFPNYKGNPDYFIFTGRALSKIDGSSVIIKKLK